MSGTTLRFSAVVLAAGLSARMQGANKLLLPLGAQTVIGRTVRALLGARPQELVVVTGFAAEAVCRALEGLDVHLQHNAQFAQGQMSSVSAGVGALCRATDAVLICLGDMPLLTSADYVQLVQSHARHLDKSILVPHYEDRRGNPVLIAQAHLARLVGGGTNLGCRRLIAEHPREVHVHAATHDRYVTDLDTPQDYAQVLRRWEAANAEATESPA
jgi:molybdenum cofactor cytidylyltransferase